ncbi:CYFA0S08e05182g1_1 [Cyberlindnera fabianii]|uniref:Altered inheritance of mitochondria protein 6 n=1 Tax=Cyberlindnera fabianii TaxID=36022 RepID=A0A061AX47_CYBFA|nr:CYFA0S08e05182g1_1 [Cyberlindnera fabianii]
MSEETLLDSSSSYQEDIDNKLSPLEAFEYQDPVTDHRIQVMKLTRWNRFWKYTACISSFLALMSLIAASMVVRYSHNPTFVNDLFISTLGGSSWYAPSYSTEPRGKSSSHGSSSSSSSSSHLHHWVPHGMPQILTVQKLNQGKPVLPVHSHNDYWRHFPLFEALSLGCQSVEADIWHLDGYEAELFVGHHKRSLSSFKTLHNMYLEPLEALLDQQNAHDVLIQENEDTDDEEEDQFDEEEDEFDKRIGVFDYDPNATMYFVLDVKNDPDVVFEMIVRSFARFAKKGYLTTFNTETQQWKYGPVTLIISGDVPVQKISQQRIRTMFVDAPMAKLMKMQDIAKDQNIVNYNASTGISIFASASLKDIIDGSRAFRFSGGLSERELSMVKKTIDTAHLLGLKIRIWETPAWPATQRDDVWRQLTALGVDLLNADDLHAAVLL